MLALTKSFRINNDKIMIKKGKIKAKIKGNVLKKNDENEFGVEISNDGKIVTINGEKQDKVSDYVSKINVILFNPSDTRLIDDAPSERRKMLNIEISQIYKEYLVVLTNYQRILKQRNFYIRGMYINGVYYEPTFLYESLWCLLGFVILLLIRKFYKCKKIGFMTGIYFVIYPMGRFFIEAHRSDSLYIGSYRVSMLLSVVLIILGIVLIVTSRKRGRYCEEV